MRQIPSLAEDFSSLMHKQFPDAAQLLQAINEGEPVIGIRQNPRKLRTLPWETESVPWEKYGLVLKEAAHPPDHPLYSAGAFYMQEPSAMCAVPELEVRPGMRVLDLCAAPGGKTGQIAQAMGYSGFLLANDVDRKRAQVLSFNLAQLGITCATVTNEAPDRLAQRFPEFFDRILVDAPCSGEGMFRRNPNSRTAWNAASPASCARRQLAILRTASTMLRPGGRLVYSTCTFNRTENEDVVERFVQENPSFTLVKVQRIFPHTHTGEGHFAAVLQSLGEEYVPLSRTPAQTTEPPLWQAFMQANLQNVDFPGAIQEDNRLFVPAFTHPSLQSLHVVSSGLSLARVTNQRLEPNHALAMALSPHQAQRSINLDDRQAKTYLSGLSVPMEDAPAGWTLACYDDLPLGWGKVSDGQLKNRLPKGLRRNHLDW